MNKTIILVSLSSVLLFCTVFIINSNQPSEIENTHKTLRANLIDDQQIHSAAPKNKSLITANKPKADEHIRPPRVEELTGKIYAATDNWQFIQTVQDIEFGARYKDVKPLLNELFSHWVSVDPIAALNYSQLLSRRYDDNSFRLHALEQAAIHSVADAESWLYKNLGSVKENDLNTLAVYSGLSVNDPVAALQRINDINNTYLKHKLELRAISEWAKHEPAQAMAWLESESSFTHQIGMNDAYVAVVAPIIETAPDQAEAIILDMLPSKQKNTLVSQLAIKLTEEDPETAMQWAQDLTDKQAYNTAVSTTLKTLIHSEKGQLTAIEFAESESDPELRRHFVSQTIGYIAHQNPTAAAQKLSSLPFEQQQDIAVAIAYSFANDDMGSRRLWINSLPNEELRQGVSEALLQ